jgi:hypothetical protein
VGSFEESEQLQPPSAGILDPCKVLPYPTSSHALPNPESVVGDTQRPGDLSNEYSGK